MRSLTLLSTLLALALTGISTRAYGQEEHIETDRDSFTRSPRIVAPGEVILEGSYTYLEQDAEFDGHLFPDLLLRYGMHESLELRLGWTYEIGKFHHLAHPEAERVEEGLAIYGVKVFLTEAEGCLPDSSLILSGYTPTSGDSNDTDMSLEYAFGWKWGEGWELDGGFRWFTLTEEHDHFTELAPSLVFKAPLCDPRWNAHVEYFGLFSSQREENYQQHYFGPGIHYLITPDIEIGTRVFWGFGDDSAEFLCNVGMGVRF